MIQVPKNNRFRKTRSRLGQETPQKEVEPIAPNSEAESLNKIYYVCMYGNTYSKSTDQPVKVASPARGQLNRKNEYFPVRVRA